MEHAFVLCNRNIITFDNLPYDFMAAPETVRNTATVNAETDIQGILEALEKTSWNKAKAARLLGIDRVTLYRKIKRYNITEDSSRN
jgi:transcriptional regulator of acetoin/glycerol metabolism